MVIVVAPDALREPSGGFAALSPRTDMALGKGGVSGTVSICRKRGERKRTLARRCGQGIWTGVLGGGVDGALT